MKKNKTISIGLSVILIVGAFAYLVLSSFGESMIYYKTVDELLSESSRFAEQLVRINGVLVNGSVRQKAGTNQYRFQISKRGKVLDVEYAGILPDAMQDGRELVVQGILKTDRNTFYASEILTKCPSKHEARAQAAGP
ncbi:MAG: cytochrome c maturation protein CcmE [Proteobacteria bacterium]|nr:cytochrome c maturation protein CcmE [Pseudomonadota bacterium]